MSVSALTIVRHRKIGAVERLGRNAQRLACRCQGHVMDAGAEVGELQEHLEIQALADRQGDPIRARIWRLMLTAAETAKREGAYETHDLLVEMRTLAHRYEACERIEDERREAMRLHVGSAKHGLKAGAALLDTLITGESPN